MGLLKLNLREYPGGTMVDPYVHYDPEVDIALIAFEAGRSVSQRYSWGLIDRDRDTGRLMGFEIWDASKILPAEMIEALRTADKPHGVAA
jgi:uncharacterized protein YuzE